MKPNNLFIGVFFLVVSFSNYERSYSQGKDVVYSHNDVKLKGYVVKPAENKKNAPGILVLSAWMGINDHSKESANKLGKLGYNAMVADIYGMGNNPENAQQAGQLAGKFKKDYLLYQERIKAGLAELIKNGADPENIAVIGYCFGGTGALEAARGNLPVKGVVSIHGSLGRDSLRKSSILKPSILVLHGAVDPFVPEKEIQSFVNEVREGKADWQMIWYADAVHAFTEKSAGNDKSKGAAYNELAAQRSWEHLKLFLDQLFKEEK